MGRGGGDDGAAHSSQVWTMRRSAQVLSTSVCVCAPPCPQYGQKRTFLHKMFRTLHNKAKLFEYDKEIDPDGITTMKK